MADTSILMEEPEDLPDLIDEGPASKMPPLMEQYAQKAEEWKVAKAKKRKAKDVEMGDASEESSQNPEDILKKVSVEAETMDTQTDAVPSKRPKSDLAEVRKIPFPPNRYGPLKESWVSLVTPVVKELELQMRCNMKKRCVEIRNPPGARDNTKLQKAADFVRAFILGFDVQDAMALVRLDHLFVESFEIDDVKFTLKGENKARAIGRIAGQHGQTKFTIENTTKTRIVLAGSKIHILGAYQNIRMARHSICSLILGAQPAKVYGSLRHFAARLNERL